MVTYVAYVCDHIHRKSPNNKIQCLTARVTSLSLAIGQTLPGTGYFERPSMYDGHMASFFPSKIFKYSLVRTCEHLPMLRSP